MITAIAIITAGIAIVAIVLTTDSDDGSDTADTPTATTPAATRSSAEAPAAAGPSVAELMKQAGCKGKVIDTQLYSRETGRCKLGGAEVTVATFDTPALRSQWVRSVRELGGTSHIGDGWAVWSPNRAAASNFAAAIR